MENGHQQEKQQLELKLREALDSNKKLLQAEKELEETKNGFKELQKHVRTLEEELSIEKNQSGLVPTLQNKIREISIQGDQARNELSKKLEEEQNRVKLFEGIIKKNNRQIDELRNTLGEKEKRINELVPLIEKSDMLNRELEETRSKRINELVPLIEKSDMLNRELEETRSNLRKMQKDLLEMTSKYMEAKKDTESQKGKSASDKDNKDQSPASNGSNAAGAKGAQQKIEITYQELLQWDKKTKDLTKQLKEVNAQKKQLEFQLQNLKLEVTEKTKLLESIQSRQGFTVGGLEERCKALERILDETTRKNQSLENKVIALEDENSNMRADYEAKIEEVKTFRKVAKEKFEKERELNELKMEFESFKTKHNQFEQEYKQTEEKTQFIQELAAENESLTAQIASMKQEMSGSHDTLFKLKKEVEASGVELTEKNKVIEEITQEIMTLRSREKDLNQKIAATRSSFEEFKVEAGILTKRTQNELKVIKVLLNHEKQKAEHFEKKRDELIREKEELYERLVQGSDIDVGGKNNVSKGDVYQELLQWDKKPKDLTKELEEINAQKNELEFKLENLKLELTEKIKLIESIQSRQGFTVEGLEKREKVLEKILDETRMKYQSLEKRVIILEDKNSSMSN